MSQETVNNVKRVTYLLAPRHWFFPAEPRDGARYERMRRGHVKYRFVIDMASLEA